MGINIHRSDERGRGDHGWLKSRFSFSFADYFNRHRMGFGALRVLNDDIIAGGSGFPMHPHDNMEIVTIVTEGTLEHKDSLGNGSIIRPGEVQRMSAGSGIVHSEWNPSDETLKLFQIWIQTRDRGIQPEYGQTAFDFEGRKGELITIASGEEDEEGLTFHQDAWMKRGVLTAGQEHTYEMHGDRFGLFVFVISGEVTIDGNTLKDRDELTAVDMPSLSIKAAKETDILTIEVPL